MVDLFLALLLISIAILVFGLIAPAKALGWYKGTRTRKKALTYYGIPVIVFMIAFGVSSDNAPAENSADNVAPAKETAKTIVPASKSANETPQPEVSVETTDPHEFTYAIPESEFVYNGKITAIETKTVSNVFANKEKQYTEDPMDDGYKLTIRFTLTNPYDQVIMTPIEEYFYISTPDGLFTGHGGTYSRSCACRIDNSTTLTDTRGKRMRELTNRTCGNSKSCVKFEPGETKEFVLRFTYPVHENTTRLVFWGFNKRTPEKDSRYSREITFEIDTELKQVVGTRIMKI